MRGLLCGTTARTNEEYKKVVKVRMNRFIGLGLIGALTVALALLVEFYWKLEVEERMFSYYIGIGSGLMGASAAMWVKNRRILGSEEKLKESRISNADERIREIGSRAFRTAAMVMLVAMYAIALIGGLFYPILIQVLFAAICLFALSYLISYRVYDKKM